MSSFWTLYVIINNEHPVTRKCASVRLRKNPKRFYFLLVSFNLERARCEFSPPLTSSIPLSSCRVSLNLCLPEALLLWFSWTLKVYERNSWLSHVRVLCVTPCHTQYICLWQRALHFPLLHSIESVTWKGNEGSFLEIAVNVYGG